MTDIAVMDGIMEIKGANAVWMDPVAVLSSSYSNFAISRSHYYSRSSFDNRSCSTAGTGNDIADKGSRKRKRKKTYIPNEKELSAELRHQEARLAIVNAHSSFLEIMHAEMCSRVTLDICKNSQCTKSTHTQCTDSTPALPSATKGTEEYYVDFRKLAEVWQAPLYELNILKNPPEIIPGGRPDNGGQELISSTHQLFNAFIEHEDEEAVAKCVGASFLLPKHCRFLIMCSGRAQSVTSSLPAFALSRGDDTSISGDSNSGYNLIVIDPPWENKSVHRNSLYPTMPNRQLLSLPVKHLIHREGALVALWLTNREKLHQFVENELFPAWGVKLATIWYWLKLNGSGAMISPLDLQHHKPYECLLIGYLFGERQEASIGNPEQVVMKKLADIGQTTPPKQFVVMSVPGDHSRKPPVGTLLAQYAPGSLPTRRIELFARELNTGWTSWGNEPLHFQNLKYFQHKAQISSMMAVG